MDYKYKELNSCVKGEQINIKFSGVKKICLALLTPDAFKQYKEDLDNVQRYIIETSPDLFTATQDGDLVAVADLDGQDIKHVKVEIEGRYAPNIKQTQIDTHNPNIGKALVRNAEDTTTEGSMIQYWEDNKSSSTKIDLDKFVCPSCQKRTSRDHIHGAHVQKVRGSKWYITPTCDTCNTFKTKRIFQVNACDLVEAPNN